MLNFTSVNFDFENGIYSTIILSQQLQVIEDLAKDLTAMVKLKGSKSGLTLEEGESLPNGVKIEKIKTDEEKYAYCLNIPVFTDSLSVIYDNIPRRMFYRVLDKRNALIQRFLISHHHVENFFIVPTVFVRSTEPDTAMFYYRVDKSHKTDDGMIHCIEGDTKAGRIMYNGNSEEEVIVNYLGGSCASYICTFDSPFKNYLDKIFGGFDFNDYLKIS